jgi:hypothetical protein
VIGATFNFQLSLSILETVSKYTIQLHVPAGQGQLDKGCWIVLLHATRIPPHIGLLFNGHYCSLNLKGRETDIGIQVLLRTIRSQEIAAIFVKLMPHPVFSVDFLHEHFKLELEGYEKVTAGTTCFAPVRSFMQENYLLKFDDLEYLYELFPVLYREQMISQAFGINLEQTMTFQFEPYTAQDIADKLNGVEQAVRSPSQRYNDYNREKMDR